MYYFIVNPASKSGHGSKIWKNIEAYLVSEGVDFLVHFSKCPGHAKEIMYDICSEHLEDEENVNVIVLGGDGTLNEVVQGIISFDKVNLGYIPSGSGNDFAKSFDYPSDPVETLKRILSCQSTRKLDIGKIKISDIEEKSIIAGATFNSTRYFNAACGMGFDASVCADILNSNAKPVLNKLGLGKLVYLLTALKTIFSMKLCDVYLSLGNSKIVEVKKCRFIVGMNTSYEGGGFKFCPSAVPNDGYLDICAVGKISALGILLALPLAPKGKHTIFKKHIKTYRVKSYEIHAKEPLWIHTDGEVHAKAKTLKVSLVPGGLNFIW